MINFFVEKKFYLGILFSSLIIVGIVDGCAGWPGRATPTPSEVEVDQGPLPEPPYRATKTSPLDPLAPTPTPTPENQVTIDKTFANKEVTLTEDEFLAIELEINPSTPYMWMVTEVGGSQQEPVVRQIPQVSFEQTSELVGAPIKQVIRFAPLQAGASHINLAYRSSLTAAVAPLDTFSVQVRASEVTAGENGWLAASPRRSSPPATGPDRGLQFDDNSALGLPTTFDWCAQAECPPIKDQGNCGSCWAFATTGVLEANLQIKDNVERDLSEQALLSCNRHNYSCDGGWWVFDYFISPGSVYEADFPYAAFNIPEGRGRTGALCRANLSFHEKIVSWGFVGGQRYIQPSVAALKQAIYTFGPISAAVCVGPAFNHYRNGIFRTDERYACDPYYVNHAVVLTGWDDTQQIFFLRNSWGTGWGENGNMRIGYGVSNVGFNAAYAVYEGQDDKSVVQPPVSPQNLIAVGSGDQIKLSWEDHSDNEDGFEIYRWNEVNEVWQVQHRVNANVTVYTDKGECNQQYYYQIQAFNDNGNSPDSNLAKATTGGCGGLQTPINLEAVALMDQVELSWSMPVDLQDGFIIIARWGEDQWHVFLVEGDETAYLDTDVLPGVTYYYMLGAFDGKSNFSNWSSFVRVALPLPQLNPPRNLASRTVSKTQINLTWDDNNTFAKSFIIERWNGQSWQAIERVGPNVEKFADTNLSCDTTYYYMISVTNNNSFNYSSLVKGKTDGC